MLFKHALSARSVCHMSLEKYDECSLGKDSEGDYRRLFHVTFFFFFRTTRGAKNNRDMRKLLATSVFV